LSLKCRYTTKCIVLIFVSRRLKKSSTEFNSQLDCPSLSNYSLQTEVHRCRFARELNYSTTKIEQYIIMLYLMFVKFSPGEVGGYSTSMVFYITIFHVQNHITTTVGLLLQYYYLRDQYLPLTCRIV